MITSCNKEMFRRYFIAALCNIGIDIAEANKFCVPGNKTKLEELYICVPISLVIDEFIEARVPDYKGCMPDNTWDDIVKYNMN